MLDWEPPPPPMERLPRDEEYDAWTRHKVSVKYGLYNKPREYLWKEENDRNTRFILSRAFIITSKGYMGLAPAGTQPGDIVCVLRGGDVTYILRPINEYHRLVGECYVEGIMNGSFARRASPSEIGKFYLK